jgi:hypothetical protein
MTWEEGEWQRAVDEIYRSLEWLGYKPTRDNLADVNASAQWRLRQIGEKPKSYDDVEIALMEALVIQGSCKVWRGDGLACAGQIVWAQHRRAEKAEAERDALVKALKAFVVHATYPVSTEINQRGYAWRGEEALDYAKGLADYAFSLVGGPD